jgi:hypothetical protein
MIDHLWDEEAGIFRHCTTKSQFRYSRRSTCIPLWTGQLPTGNNDRLVEHLTNPETFSGRFRLPTVAYNDPSYTPHKMWRGPVWANINYFFIEALQMIGRDDLAVELREQTLEMIASQPGISEYYDSLDGTAPPSPSRPSDGHRRSLSIWQFRQAAPMQKRTGLSNMKDEGLWYKDAIFYQVYVRAWNYSRRRIARISASSWTWC